jgi:hypothetical protein
LSLDFLSDIPITIYRTMPFPQIIPTAYAIPILSTNPSIFFRSSTLHRLSHAISAAIPIHPSFVPVGFSGSPGNSKPSKMVFLRSLLEVSWLATLFLLFFRRREEGVTFSDRVFDFVAELTEGAGGVEDVLDGGVWVVFCGFGRRT